MTLAYMVMSGEVVLAVIKSPNSPQSQGSHKSTVVADSGAWADLYTGSPEETQSRPRSQA